jgi:surface antigen
MSKRGLTAAASRDGAGAELGTGGLFGGASGVPNTLLRRSIVVACLATTAIPVLAQSQLYGTLKGTPMEVMDDEDRRLFREASDKALNEAAVNEVVRWENPKTQSHGELTVLNAFEWKKAPCRTIRVSNEARGRKATNNFNLCHMGEKWRMVSPSELKKAG